MIKIFLLITIGLFILQDEQPKHNYNSQISNYQLLNDTIIIDTEQLEGDSNHTALQLDKGLYRVGDTLVDLSTFKFLDTTIRWKDLSYRKDLVSFMRVELKPYEENNRHDSTLLFGKAIRKKPAGRDHYYYGYQEQSEFKNRCPPMQCPYYYITMDKKGKVKQLRSLAELATVIHVRKPMDAFFLLEDELYQSGRYCKTPTGYYIMVNKIISHCSIQYADILYYVSNKGSAEELARNITWVTNACY
jgi:hypothetical protein